MEYAGAVAAKRERFDYLDGWRGIAIASVLLSHFFSIESLYLGRLGVDLFFVLSGLLMSRILYEERTPLPVFYRRRASRVFPVFALFVVVMVLASQILNLRYTSDEILATLSFTRTYFPAGLPIWDSEVPITHLWSLNVEEHSYILLSLLTLIPFLRRREGPTLIGLSLLTLVISVLYVKGFAPSEDWELRTECAAAALLMSAGYRQVCNKFSAYVRPWMPLVAFAAGVSCYLWCAPFWTRILVAPFLFAFSVNHIGETYAVVLRALSTKTLVMLGIWSYSLYIWQQPFYKLKEFLPAGMPLLMAFACGTASFYLFESPIRRWLNRNWNGSSPSPVPA